MTILKVQGTHLIRDTNSGALINRDMNGLQEYNKKKTNDGQSKRRNKYYQNRC